MSLTDHLTDQQTAALVSVGLTPPAPPAPPPDDVMGRLEADARRPAEEAVQVAAALRESLEPARRRAAACLAGLQPQQPAILAKLRRIQALPLTEYTLKLSDGAGVVRHLQSVVDRLTCLFAPRADEAGVVPSVLETLAAIPRAIDRLGATDHHLCPTPPPPCGCAAGRIRAGVADAERAAARLPDDLRALDALLERLTCALARRGGVAVVAGGPLSARPTPTPALTDFDPRT